MNTASMELKLTNSFKHGQREVISYRAQCPAHERWSSNYQGQDDKGLVFKCAESSGHLAHYFHAKPPRDAPKTAEEVAAWMARKREERIAVKPKKKGA